LNERLPAVSKKSAPELDKKKRVAVVDYGLGNLFSVKQACLNAGLQAEVTTERKDLAAADAVILPGVGAFGDAMQALHKLDLIGPLRELADAGKYLMGVCLGMQLLLTESEEFGEHRGLDIIPGTVLRFPAMENERRKLKIPQMGWNRIYRPPLETAGDPWGNSPLMELNEEPFFYFVHSYYANPETKEVVLAMSRYGDVEFCAGMRLGNIFAFQFHPERSGPQGLQIYNSFAHLIHTRD